MRSGVSFDVATTSDDLDRWIPGADRHGKQPDSVTVPIKALRASDSPRLGGEDTSHVRLLAESGATLPPILVHRGTMRVIDGMHRLRAAERRGDDTIRITFFDGSEQDAFLVGLAENVRHGLPLSLADRKAAATRVITFHPEWSDRAVASIAGLSHKTVGVIRRRLAGEIPQSDRRVGRDGHMHPVAGTVQGRRIAGQVIADNPTASLRHIANVARISTETARDVRARVREGRDPALPARRSPAAPAAFTGSPSDAPPDAAVRHLASQPGVLQNLRGDPTLRFSSTGRALLRLFALHTMPTDGWSALADVIPPHRRQAVADAANECARAWEMFAEQLE